MNRQATKTGQGGIKTDSFQSGLFIVIPTYNERGNIQKLVGDLLELPIPDIQIVIVDDNSPDGTGELADKLRVETHGAVHVIHRTGKLGLGSAYREGFKYALDQGAEYIVQMDADFSHSPSYIPEFLRAIADYDVIVGSRYVVGGKLDPRWGKGRYRLSAWANGLYVKLLLGLGVKDATGGFKLWSRQTLSDLLSHSLQSKGYVFQVEMAYLTELLGYRVKERPIFFQERQSGTSKMSLAIKLEAAWRTILLRWQYRHLRKRAVATESSEGFRVVDKNNYQSPASSEHK